MNRNKSFNSIFLFVVVLLVCVIFIEYGKSFISSQSGTYSMNEFERDLDEGKVACVLIMPNAETPTGSVRVSFNDGSDDVTFNSTDVAAIESYLNDAREIFKRRRDLIVRRINEIEGMHIEPPKGAFYAFPEYDLKMKSADLAMELIKNGLVCTPGSAFGSYGEGHLRFSYAADEEKISKGMDILAKVYTKLRKEGQ